MNRRNRTHDGNKLTPGHNVDALNISTGMAQAQALGFQGDTETGMMISYALHRWARGEEEAAEKMAIGAGVWKEDVDHPTISLEQWRMILAAAMAGSGLPS